MKVPVIGESITEVTLSQWLKANGDYVKLDEPICEFESDKATLEFPAEAAGKLIYVAAEDDDLEIGALVAKIDTSVQQESGGDSPVAETPATAKKTEETASSPVVASEKPASYASGHPSPAASKILAEKGVDPKSVQGSGRDGRITKADAQQISVAQPQVSVSPTEKPAEKPASAVAFSRNESTQKMSRMRRTIAARLTKAKNETAMLTTFNEVDLTEVMKLRKEVQEDFVEKFGVKLGFMSLFSKACAKALVEKPDVNAFIHENGKEIIYHDYVDISIAISTPTGLVVPPVKNVESLNFAEIELEIKRLAGKARNGTLSLDEMQGGTFAITNGGIFGSLLSTPILNAPQSAILGMHNIVSRPMAINGQVEIRPMMYLALSYDHRVIDGSTSVSFLVRVKQLLENPNLLLLDV